MKNTADGTEKQLPVAKIVFYFSGTGNSYYVAKTIADSIGAVLRPIVSLKKGEEIEADILCFVFPVYDFKPPKKVSEIVENLSKISANYTIAIATYGVALSSTLVSFGKSLSEKGIKLSGGYGIKSPHNAVGSAGADEGELHKRLADTDKKICDIVGHLQKRITVDVEKTSVFEDGTIVKHIPQIVKLLGILIFKGAKSLAFTVTDDCISCYRCQRICPATNIKLIDGKPVFGNNCTGCFACLQWCPESAILVGKYSFEEIGIQHYHHPKVKAEDLIADNSREKRNLV